MVCWWGVCLRVAWCLRDLRDCVSVVIVRCGSDYCFVVIHVRCGCYILSNADHCSQRMAANERQIVVIASDR